MGQLLIVQGGPEAEARALFDRALRVFDSVYPMKATDVLWRGATGVAKFPRLKVLGTGIARDDNDARWICGAGTWFYNGANGLGSLHALKVGMAGMNFGPLDGAFVLAYGGLDPSEFILITDRIGTLHVYQT